MEEHQQIWCKAKSNSNWKCLSKHMADADIPNTNTSLSAKSSIGDNIENYATWCKPKGKVVQPVEYTTIKQPRTMCNATSQPNPKLLLLGKHQIKA